jgi:hypothetical protein
VVKTEKYKIIVRCLSIAPTLLLSLLLLNTGFAQNLSNKRERSIQIISDTVQLDTLSLIPQSIIITSKQQSTIDTSFYKIDYAKSRLYLNRKKLNEQGINTDTLNFSFRVFPFSFNQRVLHKDIKRIQPNQFGAINPFNYVIDKPAGDIFKTEGLTKNGSISRGINFGNNQDVVVNSNLNLQVSGKLTDNIDILLAATDNNIPIQPEGNTQQLQEFDKVFIQLNDKKSKLIAGDYQVANQGGYFMRFNKKAQGANFTTMFETRPAQSDSSKKGIMTVTGSAAVSRGKFARNIIQGIEKNQGPYFLKGAENEQFIIVLSGSEKVYIDGLLMQRGQQNDYIIDYNTAQITFTAKRLITKDKRIVVEFQYSDKNFARSLFHIGDEYKQGNLKIRFNAYSEQDSKNKPIQQQLTDVQKKILANAGDDLSQAISPGADSIAFSTAEVLYRKVDTLGYIGVYVYSTDSAQAHYRLKFSQVTKGNYRQISSSANGKVYQWVPPIAGEPQGNYEPVIQLISPKQKQMVTLGVDYKLNNNTGFTVETAVSNNDINTFSAKDKANDVGYGIKMGLDNVKKFHNSSDSVDVSKTLQLVSNINYEYVQQNFNPIERFRAVEFERDWNRPSALQSSDQHIVGGGLSLVKPNFLNIGYRFNSFMEGSYYNAFKQGVMTSIAKKGFKLNFDGSLMNSNSTFNTTFLRHNGIISQNLGVVTLGIKEQQERNEFRDKNTDTLLYNSAGFFEWTGFATNADTSKVKYNLSYKQRNDYGVRAQLLRKSTFAQETSFNIGFLSDPNNQVNINATYRTLQITDTLISRIKPDQTLLGRIEHNFSAGHGFFTTNTFYEIGSGQEVKKEFSYLEVAAGQGVYAWTDYNSNGVKELNEFEVSVFKDQARFIKIYTPTNQTITAYTNQFSEALNIKPAAIWSSKKGVRKIISLFANQTAYRVDKKTTDSDLENSYNPFRQSNADSSLKSLNSSFRNSVFFNQLSPVFGLDFNYQDVRNRSLLTDGIDTRIAILREVKIRWNMSRVFSLNVGVNNGEKLNTSQFFSTRNYNISYTGTEPKINFQPNTSFRLSLAFKYVDKKNTQDLGGQKVIQQNYGLELRYNVLQKGSFSAKANFIQLTYNDSPNSSVAYEMLEGLKPGQNITWNASYQQNLANNLTISINYDGRQSEGSKAIHTGGAQVRAYF